MAVNEDGRHGEAENGAHITDRHAVARDPADGARSAHSREQGVVKDQPTLVAVISDDKDRHDQGQKNMQIGDMVAEKSQHCRPKDAGPGEEAEESHFTAAVVRPVAEHRHGQSH